MGSIISGIGSMIGGQQASSADKAASAQAQEMYRLTANNLQPYINTGSAALSPLLTAATAGTTGGGTDYVAAANANMPSKVLTQAGLEQTPGYQFTLGQGLKMTQAANAAKGLGVSGAALKGAATYATGLADSTYSNRFSEAQQGFNDYLNLNTGQQGQLTNQFNRLYQTAGLGQTAASNLGDIGAADVKTSANALESAGTAEAQGTKGLTTGIGNALNQFIGYETGGTSGYQNSKNA